MKNLKNEAGGSMIEAAITLPFFMLIILACMSLSLALYKYVSLQYTVDTTARWALLGKEIDGLSREQSIEDQAINIGALYGLNFGATYTSGVDHAGISICAPAAPCSDDSAGSPGEFFQITAVQPVSFLGLSMNLRATALAGS